MSEGLVKTVSAELEKQGLALEPINDAPNQRGAQTHNYVLDSNQGKVVLKLGIDSRHLDSHLESMRVRVGLAKFLEAYPEIPSPVVLAHGAADGVAYMVQQYVPGVDWVDCRDSTAHLKHLGEVLAEVHSVDVKGSGDFAFEEGVPVGKYDDWLGFIKQKSYDSLDELYNYLIASPEIKSAGVRKAGAALKHHLFGKKALRTDKENVRRQLETFFDKFGSVLQREKSCLLHSDVWWNNVRVDGDKVSGLLDWEYSHAGDPAFDMVFIYEQKHEVLPHYFNALREKGAEVDETRFTERVELYKVVKGLFAANAVKRTKFFKHVFRSFRQSLDSYVD